MTKIKKEKKLFVANIETLQRDLFASLLRMLAVGRRQQFESIEVALDIME